MLFRSLSLKNIAVNLSGRQFKQLDLVSNIEKIILDSGIQPGFLELEITETILMENLDTVTIKLKQLSEMGIHLSLDDFGTGYSSLSYLRDFAIDKLKIDRSFVNEINTRNTQRSIISAIIAMAHTLGLKVVAEGIEEPEQLKFLIDQNCDIAQGFLFSKPLPAN